VRLQPNVTILAISLFGLALGEELWQAYMPAYLTALGASGVAVGLYGSLKDLLDSLYQYPGGWLADRFGRRRALLTFTTLATAGYAIYAVAAAWPVVFAGLIGVMAWKAGAFPTTFAVIGDSLPRERRGVAFSVQSILVRVPRVIGAPIGGLLLAGAGMVAGFRIAVIITIALALAVLAMQFVAFKDGPRPSRGDTRDSSQDALPPALVRLLAADSLVRIGEGIAASFIVLYVTGTLQVSAPHFGILYAVQQFVAIASYLPGGRMADAMGRTPLVVLTFVFFAAFPLAVRLAGGSEWIVAAFVVGGLKEIGEPARKSLIVDLAPDDRRARVVGLYYAIRNLLVVPAGVLGGLIWQRSPQLTLEVAGLTSAFGVVVFLMLPRPNPEPRL
jgi:predicted MFS family arabinose efflux permease